MALFRNLLSSEHGLYINIEYVIHTLLVAATAVSVESIVESWISVYEGYSNKYRSISNERAEMKIYGPLLQHADSVIEQALKDMYSEAKDKNNRRTGHFVRRSSNVTDIMVSKSVDAFMKLLN